MESSIVTLESFWALWKVPVLPWRVSGPCGKFQCYLGEFLGPVESSSVPDLVALMRTVHGVQLLSSQNHTHVLE